MTNQLNFFLAGSIPSNFRLPSVRYKKAPIYFLLFPEYKFTENIGEDYYFEGDRCGDLILTNAWTVDEVVALYRAEYARSNDIRLVVDLADRRMIDLISGKIAGWESYKGNIFYGTIEPKDEMRGNEKFWLLSTPGPMFRIFWSVNVPL